jgi:phytanoyl-CoA dioxygenase PhyH
MRNEIQIAGNEVARLQVLSQPDPTIDDLVARLQRDGVVVLPELVSSQALGAMQQAFASRLRHLSWNNINGYQKTEPYRHLVEDLLALDQGFVDLAIHPIVKAVLNQYLGNDYELTEAKGWKSIPTKVDFHGWHGDSWYDESQSDEIHKEVKLAIYLSDVRSGALNYVKGSHRKQHPRQVRNEEVAALDRSQIVELLGKAGTVILFDTSGIHRQGVPMLEERQACFFNYHNPGVALLKDAVDYYRYHPLLLNAAFLGGLSHEDERILGFGNKTNFQPAFVRKTKPSFLYRTLNNAYSAELRLRNLKELFLARLKRTFG